MRVFLTHTPDVFATYYGERALAALSQVAEVRRNGAGRVLAGAELARAAAGCEAVIADRAHAANADFFAAADDLAAFLRCAVDVSTVDIAAASAHGVLVTRATPGFADSVAELAVGMMVDLARGVSASVAAFRAGRTPEGRMGRQLSGSTLGIVGYGTIGRRLAATGRALGMHVLVADPHAAPDDPALEHVPLAALLPRADFVVLLAVASPETQGMMDAAAFAAMRPGAFFLNLSRGQLVDEDALAAALDAGRLAGAAMDVGRAPDQMPSPILAARPDVIATPHVGGATPPAVEHQAFDTVAQVGALARGELPANALNAASARRLARLGIALPG